MKIRCLFGHAWNNCYCVRCGKTRGEGHEGHDWHGCKCERCGQTRDSEHQWNVCHCIRCGQTRDEGHDWQGCQCVRCGQTRDYGHDWQGCQCVRCGQTHDWSHSWEDVGSLFNDPDPAACGGTSTVYKCRSCGETYSDGYIRPKGDCRFCARCGARR